jgi:hypothetical protein
MLEEEIRYFEENHETWKSQYPGKFVLIKGSELIGVYDTMLAALDDGSRRFGLVSYLIRRVGEVVKEISIPALTMGILRANPAHSDSGTRADS